jgi:4'-phosphopantetheinyl transferase
MQRDRFFRVWTLKESYIKARGMGLALPLDGFEFTFQKEPGIEPKITIRIDAALSDEADSWTFRSLAPSDTHRLALAVRSHGRTTHLNVTTMDWNDLLRTRAL